MRAAQHHFNRDRLFPDVQVLDVKPKVREPAEKLAVEGAHGFPALMQFIVGQEARLVPEGVHHRVEIMGILDAEMLLYSLDPSRTPAVADRWHSKPPLKGALS